MSAMTQRALAQRAIRSARLMELTAKLVQAQMAKQNIPMPERDGQTLAMPAYEVYSLVSHMIPLAAEIRGFQQKLATQKRGRERPVKLGHYRGIARLPTTASVWYTPPFARAEV
jgi:hypothetical protein